MNEDCCVCYERIGQYTNCGHPLCYICCGSLMKQECPMCRTKIEMLSSKRLTIKSKQVRNEYMEVECMVNGEYNKQLILKRNLLRYAFSKKFKKLLERRLYSSNIPQHIQKDKTLVITKRTRYLIENKKLNDYTDNDLLLFITFPHTRWGDKEDMYNILKLRMKHNLHIYN